MTNSGKYNNITNQFESIPLSEINQLKLLKRIDNKYVMPINKLAELLLVVKNDYQILEIDRIRDFSYKTTYFDTPDFDFYMNHQNRRLNRHKVRMRNYSVSNNSFLEVKQKTNKGRTIKSRIEIDPLVDEKILNQDYYKYLESKIPLTSHNLTRSSENSFRRITLISFKTNERITLDYDLKFTSGKKTISLPFISIVEVKRDKIGKESPIIKSLKNLKVYPRGFSKYCMGITYLYPEIKQNSFKKNKLFIKKLKYATSN